MLVFFLNFFRFYSIVQTWFDSSHAKVILSFFFPVLIIKGVSQQVASFVLSRCSTRQPLEFLLLCYSTLWNKVTLIACQRQPVLYVNRHACRYHCLLSRYCCDFHIHQTSSGDSKGGPGWPMAPSFFLNFPFKFVWLTYAGLPNAFCKNTGHFVNSARSTLCRSSYAAHGKQR